RAGRRARRAEIHGVVRRVRVDGDADLALSRDSTAARQASQPLDSVRLDRWLWAARFFKTRGLAAEAVAGGKVQLNGNRAKPAKPVEGGDTLRVRPAPYDWLVTLRSIPERRGAGRDARTCEPQLPAGPTRS